MESSGQYRYSQEEITGLPFTRLFSTRATCFAAGTRSTRLPRCFSRSLALPADAYTELYQFSLIAILYLGRFKAGAI
jgi:hypothetical protein